MSRMYACLSLQSSLEELQKVALEWKNFVNVKNVQLQSGLTSIKRSPRDLSALASIQLVNICALVMSLATNLSNLFFSKLQKRAICCTRFKIITNTENMNLCQSRRDEAFDEPRKLLSGKKSENLARGASASFTNFRAKVARSNE